MKMLAALLALCISVGGTLTDDCDIWERNTLMCAATKQPQFVQHIWWEFITYDGVSDYHVKAWRMETYCKARPREVNGVWVGTFTDGKDKVRRTIRAKLYIETQYDFDWEVADRQRLPEGKRSGLKQKEAPASFQR